MEYPRDLSPELISGLPAIIEDINPEEIIHNESIEYRVEVTDEKME